MATDPRLALHRTAAELVDGLSVLFGEPQTTIVWGFRKTAADAGKADVVELHDRLDGFNLRSLPHLLFVRLDASDPAITAAHEFGHLLEHKGRLLPGAPRTGGHCSGVADRMGQRAAKALARGWSPVLVASDLYTHFGRGLARSAEGNAP